MQKKKSDLWLIYSNNKNRLVFFVHLIYIHCLRDKIRLRKKLMQIALFGANQVAVIADLKMDVIKWYIYITKSTHR